MVPYDKFRERGLLFVNIFLDGRFFFLLLHPILSVNEIYRILYGLFTMNFYGLAEISQTLISLLPESRVISLSEATNRVLERF